MPRVTGYRVGGGGQVTGGRVAGYRVSAAVEVGPFDVLNTTFDFRTGTTDLAARGLDPLRPDSWDVLDIVGGELRTRAVSGGGDGSNTGDDLEHSFRFTLGAFVRRGNGLDALVSGDFDVRGDVTLYANDLTSAPSAGSAGTWEFLVMYLEPEASRGGAPLSTHGGPGRDGADGALRIETKETNPDSVYPMTDASTDGHIRAVKIGDVVTWYWREASSGEALESDVGWGTAAAEFTIVGISSGPVRVGISHYGSADVLGLSARWRRLYFSAVP